MAEAGHERRHPQVSSHWVLTESTRFGCESSGLATSASRSGFGFCSGSGAEKERPFHILVLARKTSLRAAVAALALLLPLLFAFPSAAVPPDERIVIKPGTDRFLRASFRVTEVVMEPEGPVTAELLPTEEILLTVSKEAKNGEVLVLAVGSDRVRAFDVCISDDGGKGCSRSPGLDSASTACPGLKRSVEDGRPVYEATISTTGCLDALKKALEHSRIDPGALRFTLEEEPAREFFGRVLKRIENDPKARGLNAAYYGATLRLQGKVPREAVLRALIHAYRETVGRVSYDDRTERP